MNSDVPISETIPNQTLNTEENETLKVPASRFEVVRKYAQTPNKMKRSGNVKFNIKSKPANEQQRSRTADGVSRPKPKQ